MIRTCDPLIRSQVLYPTELRVRRDVNIRVHAQLVKRGKMSFVLCLLFTLRATNPKYKAPSTKLKVQSTSLAPEVSGLRPGRQIRVCNLNLYLVPLASGAIALRLVRDRVESAQTRRHFPIQQCHVIEPADVV